MLSFRNIRNGLSSNLPSVPRPWNRDYRQQPGSKYKYFNYLTMLNVSNLNDEL